MPYLPGIDVVVVDYQTPGDLREFVDSFTDLQWEVPASIHIVLVDPTEADFAVTEELDNIEVPVSVTIWPSNIGYARSCNAAATMVADVEIARQTIAFFNADTILKPGVLDACHWELHQHPQWAVIGPRQVDEQNRITHGGIFGTQEKPSFEGRWHKPDTGQYSELRDDCVSVAGSAYFVKRMAWDELNDCSKYRTIAPDAGGAFLPTQHYYEETWFSYHALAHGWKVAYHGGVQMVHKWHQASPVGSDTEKRFLPESKRTFRAACDAHGIAHD